MSGEHVVRGVTPQTAESALIELGCTHVALQTAHAELQADHDAAQVVVDAAVHHETARGAWAERQGDLALWNDFIEAKDELEQAVAGWLAR